MKTPNPLAAALLLIAASAAAQPFSSGLGTGTGFSMTGANSSASPFALQLAPGSAPVDDMVFKCGTVPYVACTDAQLNLREAVRTSKKCPQPAIPACVDYLMKQSNSTNPAETIAAYNPPPGTQWASPSCTHIPCRLADSPAAPAASGQTLAGRSYEDEPGFIGPPSPFRNQGPQPFADESSFKQAMKDQEAVTPGKVIDLGNHTYAVDTGDGNYSIGGLCSGAPCNGLPKPADQIPGLADALQAANSLNSGGKSLNNDNPNGFTASSNKQTPSMNNAGQTGDQGQADDTNPSDEAKGMGRQAAADSVAVSGDSGSSGSGSSVASSGSPSSGGATPEQVIKTKAAALGSIEITYTRLQQTEDSIKGAAGAFNNGQMTGFASPNAPAASGRLAEPPVDEKYLGKIQASSNE